MDFQGNIKERAGYLYRHRFIRQVASLQVGEFGSTLVQGLAGIIIARLLQPQLFGVYSLAMSLASLIVIIVGFGLQDAVTTIVGETYAKEDRQGTHDAMMFLAKMSILVGVLSVGAYFVAPYVSSLLYHDSSIGFYASIVVFAVFVSGTFFTFSTLGLQVAGKIKQMSLLGFVDQTIRSGLSLLLVFVGFGIFGAMIGHFIGAIVVFIISVIVWRQLRRAFPIFPSLRQFKDNFWRANLGKYFSFSAWIALDKNIAALYSILPILMIGLYASSTDVSYFKISFAYVNLALSLTAPISTLLNAEFPRMRVSENDGLRRNFLRISLYSMALSTLLTAGAIAVSPIALRILYGQSFLPGLKYVFGLFVYGAFIGIGVGLGPMWRAIDKVKISIVINIVTLAIGIPGGLWLIANYGVWGAVIMVSAWFTISHLVSFFYLLNSIDNKNVV